MAKKDNNPTETQPEVDQPIAEDVLEGATQAEDGDVVVEAVGDSMEAAGLRQKLQEANEQHMRLLAEFDNFRKRSRREMDAFREYASENVLRALLPVLDDFGRTLTAMEKTDNLASIKEGILMVTEKLHKTLEKEGLNVIQTGGQPFDSELHEAIHSVEVEGDQKGKVLEEVEKGYRLKDKVIRYSKVIVGE